jgi:hypothetical protein
MKTVKVTFPEGSIQDWPAKERIIPSQEIPPGPPTVLLEPIPDDEWELTAVIGGWIASKR